MRIIDAHIHTNFAYESAGVHARELGVTFSWEALQKEMKENNIAGALIITTDHHAPTPAESDILIKQREKDPRLYPICSIHPDYTEKSHLTALELLLKKKAIFGIKIFPGYHPVYPSDKRFFPFYELAGKYGVPVIIHTGDTFGSDNLVKYSHPLDVDEIAVKFRKTTFVLAHLGNPWVRDAAELVYKNENVYADLSAFCISHPEHNEVKRITEDIKFALSYSARPDKFLYGSDWPLTSMKPYINVIKRAVPKKFHQQIFFDNANRVFKLGLDANA